MYRSREEVVVHTRDGRSIKGVLVATYRDGLALRHAVAFLEGGDSPLTGDVLIPRENVSFVQAT